MCYVAAYEGGDVIPGDDMAGSEVRWCTLDELATLPALVPRHPWLFRRAIEVKQLAPPPDLEPDV